MSELLREPIEKVYKEELEYLQKLDKDKEKPRGWHLTPKSVLSFIVGGEVEGKEIMAKYIGHDRLVEIAIATLLTDRALLLIGEPGTAKSFLSELLAAAVSFDSTKVIQGTAGTTEQQTKYSWNYAMLLAEGPNENALVKSPTIRAMESGTIIRFEEISRCNSEIQDSMISILSEKNIAIPELNEEIYAKKGFSVIATANTRDQGVNEMSSALKRRFNIVILPTPKDLETEVEIVTKRVKEITSDYLLGEDIPQRDDIEKIITIFRELREGKTLDGKNKVKQTTGGISTAEAISLLTNAQAMSHSFGNGKVRDSDLAAGLVGAVIKNEKQDKKIFLEYLENNLKDKEGYEEIYKECKELLN